MTRKFNLAVLVLLVLIGGPIWYLLIDSSPWNVPARKIDIVAARRLADAMPGPKPIGVSLEIVAWKRVPGNVLAAGSGFKRRVVAVMAFRLDFPEGRPLVIETGRTPAYASELEMDGFDPSAQAKVNTALKEASAIIVTHEHGDHLGGLAAILGGNGGSGIASRAKLNRNQVPDGQPSVALPWPEDLQIHPTISSGKLQAVAPGVVVIPTAGHTRGSQMIFVKLANGSELLFAGDTTPMAVNWQETRPSSRLITDHAVPQDRIAVIGWLKALKDAKAANPSLKIIPGHDYDWLVDPANKIGMTRMPEPGSQKGVGK
jgi:glyoxylase-like metal-dependent hydrolase (beta-lactamase superfamily II)